MSRSFLISASLLGLTIVHLSAATLEPAATTALVNQLIAQRKAHPSLQADFREEKSGGVLARPAISTGRMWYSAPDKFRREITSGKGSTVVSNGSLLWMYYPAFQEAERYDLKKQGFLNKGVATFTSGLSLENVERDYTIAADLTGDLHTLTLTPRHSSISRMISRLTIRFNRALVLREVEVTTPKGETTRTSFTNLSTDPVPDVRFEFAPPAGTTVSTPLGK